MQVKKFEAKSMKEALELVKVHMGPEAIILSAKDTHRGFGLMGEKSVEVTAAVSLETLRKMKIAESKLREELRERFHQIPAARQKQFINRVAEQRREPQMALAGREERASVSVPVRPQDRAETSNMRYIDIRDEVVPSPHDRGAARDRVRRATERALRAGKDVMQEPQPRRVPPAPVTVVPVQSAEVRAMESQLNELKFLVERFQQMPQITSMHPGAEQGLPFELSPMYQHLSKQGVQSAIVTRMLTKAQQELDREAQKNPAMVEAWLVGQLLRSVEVCATPLNGRYHVFMGSTGQGKTTSLVKFASHLVMNAKQTIAIISLDTLKVGAVDQLRIYAQILNVPFAIVRSPEEWRVAETKLNRVQHILVDCPGLNLHSMDQVNWLQRLMPPAEFDRRLHYVQSILARDEEVMDLAGRYQALGFHDVTFTRLDESSRQGLILNFQERFRVPINGLGTGPRIPEDYEFASKERIVNLLLKLSQAPKKEDLHEPSF